MTIRKIRADELQEFKEIAEDYISEEALEYIDRWFANFPDLFLADFQDGRMVGIIFGHMESKESMAIIDGIAVVSKYWGRGIGKRLIKALEENAKKLGAKRVSVGAAGKTY